MEVSIPTPSCCLFVDSKSFTSSPCRVSSMVVDRRPALAGASVCGTISRAGRRSMIRGLPPLLSAAFSLAQSVTVVGCRSNLSGHGPVRPVVWRAGLKSACPVTRQLLPSVDSRAVGCHRRNLRKTGPKRIHQPLSLSPRSGGFHPGDGGRPPVDGFCPAKHNHKGKSMRRAVVLWRLEVGRCC